MIRILLALLVSLLVSAPGWAQVIISPQPWVNGGGTARGAILRIDGTAAAPSDTYASDTDLGSYRIGANNEGFSAGGTLRWDYNTTRILSTIPYNIGTSSLDNGFLAIGTNPATAGAGRFANAATVQFRNAANSADLEALSATSGNLINVGGTNGLLITPGATGPHAIGGATTTAIQLLLTGSFTGVSNARAFGVQSTLTIPTNGAGTGLLLGPTFVEAASGTHALLSALLIDPATVTVGDAVVTDTASLYIGGAMSATVTGANYALWSDAGVNRFDGPVITGSQSVDLDGVTTFAATSSYIVLTCTGAETLNTITMTGVATGTILDIEHGDTDCTIADDDDVTAANAIDLTGATTNDVGAVNKIISLRRHSGGYWVQLSESDN